MDIQYFTQQHEMYLEGSGKKPSRKYIKNEARKRNYEVSNIDIWFDTFQGFYRCSADIHVINK